ncbi:MAG: hypothetical protein AB7K24_24385 [Gemmataceae bacterium]
MSTRNIQTDSANDRGLQIRQQALQAMLQELSLRERRVTVDAIVQVVALSHLVYGQRGK